MSFARIVLRARKATLWLRGDGYDPSLFDGDKVLLWRADKFQAGTPVHYLGRREGKQIGHVEGIWVPTESVNTEFGIRIRLHHFSASIMRDAMNSMDRLNHATVTQRDGTTFDVMFSLMPSMHKMPIGRLP